MMELKKYKISEIIETFISGDWGDEAPSDSVPNAVKCVRGADIVPIWNHDYDHIPVRYVSNRSFANKQLKFGDIIIEKSGGSPTQSTGRTAFVSEELIKSTEHLVCTNFCTAFRIKTGWNPKYVYYFLQHLYNNDVFFNFEGKTSGLKNLQIENAFDKATIVQVPIEKQNQVVQVLDIIDRKIALNRAINRNLEALAKQLYDYWFVQFDFPFDFAQGKPDENGNPYKSSGGKMVWNEVLKREIPEGWEVKRLGEIEPNIITGKTPSTADASNFDGDIPFITIDDIRQSKFIVETERTLSHKGAESQKKKYLAPNSMCCSCIGTIGLIGFCTSIAQTNQQINSIEFVDETNAEYIYFSLKQFFENVAVKSGNIFSNMNKEEFSSIHILLPTMNILQHFHQNVFSAFKNQLLFSKEITSLTRQRDELLPLLMNGQVEVKE